ncbi:hypothetical protein BDQ12DRAFT_694182 [Crucibulum laeve]|uniref:Uncharacterized protein n=1 Tax=Crucibulum laeve TaxID=68775 RepID=A0A5C3LF39_9AGAR|nr:hypothetical protein BDQ12DRAFT_694182 [Crucibulum laeve]
MSIPFILMGWILGHTFIWNAVSPSMQGREDTIATDKINRFYVPHCYIVTYFFNG